jgi:hypothetical protein
VTGAVVKKRKTIVLIRGGAVARSLLQRRAVGNIGLAGIAHQLYDSVQPSIATVRMMEMRFVDVKFGAASAVDYAPAHAAVVAAVEQREGGVALAAARGVLVIHPLH